MHKAKILVAEDEMLIANSMAAKLEGMGYRVTAITGSGKKTIEEVSRTKPDLVLMDIKLQGNMDGVTVAELIRDRFNIPVIYLTAFSDNDTISRAKLTEPFGYIYKPFDENMLHASIQMALYRHNMEKRLKESELRYRGIIVNSYDGIMLLDEEGRVVEWNSGEEQITGWKRDKAIGRPFWEIQYSLTPEPLRQKKGTCENLQKTIHDALRNGQSEAMNRESEHEIERADHTHRYIQTSMFPIKTDRGFMLGGISRDVTEHRRTEEAIRESREEMRLLAAHLQSIREEERSVVAREIHDELGQSLTAIKMDLSFMQRKLPAENQALLGKVQGMVDLVDRTVQTVKKISSQLRPGLLDDLGLASAIEWQMEEFQKRTGILCRVSLPEDDIKLTNEISTAIFRILQEALTNVARHSKATKIRVNLKQSGSVMHLVIEDNGIGITEKHINGPKSFGLIGMKERVRFLEGSIDFSGMPERGTRVDVTIPISPKSLSPDGEFA